jgi:hypothetical protein
MPINLEQHKIFIPELNLEVVPFTKAVQAVQEVQEELFKKIEETLSEVQESINDLGENID